MKLQHHSIQGGLADASEAHEGLGPLGLTAFRVT